MTAAQLPLFPARARASDPPTSHAAAASVGDGPKHAVWSLFLNSCLGFTDDEMCARRPGFYAPSLKTARSALKDAGWLEDSGERRLSDRGREMIVWRYRSPVRRVESVDVGETL